ncbi:MAG: 23S rRNA (uracil(1939)-C(5))-methyltransferase RlmD [Leptospiraceae bacterium]|nr:23S rRNA (uracil(1939)-C(5))-methyltransferase RlmD [Leptospiraceae bacterium]
MSDPTNCQHFGICGGCTLLKTKYPSQIKSKETEINKLFQSYRKLTIHPMLPSPEPFFYRHKVQMPFGRRKIGHKTLVTVGLHDVDKKFIVDQAECKIQDPGLTKAAQAIRLWARKENLNPYNEKTGWGLLRHVVLRKSHSTGEILVGIVSSEGNWPRQKDVSKSLFSHLRDALGKNGNFGKLVGIVQNTNSRKTNMVIGKETNLLWGRPYLLEKIGNYQFKVGINTFIQVNPYQIPTLYNLVKEQIPPNANVIDTYAGMGTIGIWISKQARNVVCIEENPDSFRAGIDSTKMNQVKNVKMKKGRTSDLLPQLLTESETDVLILDPPRIGVDEKSLFAINENPPAKVVYVSCDPITLQRDVGILSKSFYLTDIYPVDLFPQTNHIESVAILERKKNKD